MTTLLTSLDDTVLYLTLHRPEKHNALDEALLSQLQEAVQAAEHNPRIQVIVLRAHGRHFCAGADLNWMQRMVDTSEAENNADAMLLADTLYALYTSSKATVAIVQGSAFGGGAGLVAACDIAIAACSARFCFSEVTLGLIPAVISPYVIQAIGARAARWLFMTAETIDAQRAHELLLVHQCVTDAELTASAQALIQHLSQLPQTALSACKRLVNDIHQQTINPALSQHTAKLIAATRVSAAAQQGIQTFLNKKSTNSSAN